MSSEGPKALHETQRSWREEIVFGYGCLGGVVKSEGFRNMAGILLSRGWSAAPTTALTTSLIAYGLLENTAYARLTLLSTMVSAVIAIRVTEKVVRRFSALRVLLFTSAFDLAKNLVFLVVAAWVLYRVAVGADDATALRKPVTDWCMMPLILVGAVVSSSSFVAVVELSASEAAKFPAIAGASITLMNSMANIGIVFPANALVLAVEPAEGLLARFAMEGTSAALQRWCSIVLLGAISIVFAAWLRHRFLVPSATRMLLRPASD
jgi:hypothetical protein